MGATQQAQTTAGGRRMLVICRYAPAVRAQRQADRPATRLARLLRRITLSGLRSYVAANRDFYANPRSRDYLVDLARAERGASPGEQAELVIDAPRGSEAVSVEGFERVRCVDLGGDEAMQVAASVDDGCREIVLFYPDALGLGQHRLEKTLLRCGLPVTVVNGRRRRFALDARRRRMLAWRRWLAHTRICEVGFGLAVVPVAAVCALLDRLRGLD